MRESTNQIVKVRHYEHPSAVDRVDSRFADGTVHTHAGRSWAEARELARTSRTRAPRRPTRRDYISPADVPGATAPALARYAADRPDPGARALCADAPSTAAEQTAARPGGAHGARRCHRGDHARCLRAATATGAGAHPGQPDLGGSAGPVP